MADRCSWAQTDVCECRQSSNWHCVGAMLTIESFCASLGDAELQRGLLEGAFQGHFLGDIFQGNRDFPGTVGPPWWCGLGNAWMSALLGGNEGYQLITNFG